MINFIMVFFCLKEELGSKQLHVFLKDLNRVLHVYTYSMAFEQENPKDL